MGEKEIFNEKYKEKTVKSLLKLYRKILHGVNNGLVYLDDEVYVNTRRHLADIVEGLVPFETKKQETQFNEQVCVYHKDLELLKILDDAVIIMKDYPENGSTYYKILEMLYFNSFDYDSEDIMSILEISRSTYYRLLKKAYICYYYHLIGLLRSRNADLSENTLVENYV